MKASNNPVVGRWRIVEGDLWDRDYLDLCGPATLVVKASGDGEITFGAMQASLDIDYGPDEIGFTWAGFDEMTEVAGSGSAELHAGALALAKPTCCAAFAASAFARLRRGHDPGGRRPTREPPG